MCTQNPVFNDFDKSFSFFFSSTQLSTAPVEQMGKEELELCSDVKATI